MLTFWMARFTSSAAHSSCAKLCTAEERRKSNDPKQEVQMKKQSAMVLYKRSGRASVADESRHVNLTLHLKNEPFLK